MSKRLPAKLCVTFFPPATPYKPVDERKYTFSKCKDTGNCSLTIGYCYDESMIDPVQHNEILVEWVYRRGQYVLNGRVIMNQSDGNEEEAKKRFSAFQKELTGALTSIVNGDRSFFHNYPWLLDSPIYIYFEAKDPRFNQVFYYGKPRQYITKGHKELIF